MTEIATALQTSKSLISYYIKKATYFQYVKETLYDTFKGLELTQAGKNFLAQYEKQEEQSHNRATCRLENVRFKAIVIRMPTIPADWKKIEMNNWVQYSAEVDKIRIHLNDAKTPSIEFLPSQVDGDDPYNLYAMVLYDCTKAAEKLEETLGIEIGRLELSSRAEFLCYDPIAKEFCQHIGQVTVDGLGKVNASLPRKKGEFEFFDPRAAAEYMAMPRRLYNLEQHVSDFGKDVKEIKEILNKIKDSSNLKG